MKSKSEKIDSQYLDTQILHSQQATTPQYFGKLKNWYTQELTNREKNMVWAIMKLNSMVSKTIMEGILTWKKDQIMTVRAMLDLPLQTYGNCQRGLTNLGASGVQVFLQDMERKASWIAGFEKA